MLQGLPFRPLSPVRPLTSSSSPSPHPILVNVTWGTSPASDPHRLLNTKSNLFCQSSFPSLCITGYQSFLCPLHVSNIQYSHGQVMQGEAEGMCLSREGLPESGMLEMERHPRRFRWVLSLRINDPLSFQSNPEPKWISFISFPRQPPCLPHKLEHDQGSILK